MNNPLATGFPWNAATATSWQSTIPHSFISASPCPALTAGRNGRPAL